MAGGHSARHIAALVVQLPRDCRIARAEDADAEWTLRDMLLAHIANALNSLIWGIGDPKKRGPRPKVIGPSWVSKGRTRKLPARLLPIDELMAELAKPRKG